MGKRTYVRSGGGWVDITTGAVFPASSSAPASPQTGQVYFDTDDQKPYVYTGTSWVTIGASPYSAALTGTGTSFTVTHGLGAAWVTVMVYNVTTGKYIIPDHTINLSSGTPTGTVTIVFPASVTGSNYRVVITG